MNFKPGAIFIGDRLAIPTLRVTTEIATGMLQLPDVTANLQRFTTLMTDEVIVFSTCPDEAVAQRIAETLVSERLAACVNRVTGVRSTYVWDGALQDDAEVLLIIKTLASHLPEIETRLGTVHPYTLPEMVTIPICHGSERYLAWLRAAVTT